MLANVSDIPILGNPCEAVAEMPDTRQDQALHINAFSLFRSAYILDYLLHVRTTLNALEITYLGAFNVLGVFDQFYGVSNFFDCVDKRAHVTSDIVEEVHRGHCHFTVPLYEIHLRNLKSKYRFPTNLPRTGNKHEALVLLNHT